MNRPSSKWKKIGAALLALLVLISGSWIADGVKGEVLFSDWSGFFADRAWGLSIALVVFAAASYGLYRLRHAFANVQTLSWHKCDPHKSLILLVSTPTRGTGLDLDEDPPRLDFDARPGGAEDPEPKKSIQLSSDLSVDIEKLDNLSPYPWNWQQMMRAIKPHIVDSEKRLLRLHLVGSTDGSLQHLDSCKKWLKRYLPRVEITRDESGVNFGDFNAMVRHIQEIIDKQKKGGKGKVKFTDKDIVIDVTGGTTTASIAGASTTLNSGVTFQYVQTNPPHEVYAYDVAYLPQDE